MKFDFYEIKKAIHNWRFLLAKIEKKAEINGTPTFSNQKIWSRGPPSAEVSII